jgi:hypothetical protein
MKRTRRPSAQQPDNLRAEYTFDYAQGRKNRFASQQGPATVAVVLDPDVAQVFGTSRSVNRLLRSVIKAVPSAESVTKRRKAG